MPNLNETLKQLEISAGGPGSGRHPGSGKSKYTVEVNHRSNDKLANKAKRIIEKHGGNHSSSNQED